MTVCMNKFRIQSCFRSTGKWITILIEDIPGAKRPSYSIVYDAEDLTQFFTEVSITEENGIPYLKAIFKGKKPICERILKLDADRYQKGEVPLANLLSKYCTYMVGSNKE